MLKVGIYKITSPSGRVYVGQSINIEKRFREYLKVKNCRSQRKLYNSFKKYGVKNHKFEILEICKTYQLNKKERFYQEKFDVIKKGLNCRLTKTKSKSGRLSEETRQKMSLSSLGSKNSFFGKKHSKKNIKKISQASKGRFKSKETRQKISESQKGEKHHFVKIVLNTQTGIYYFGTREAAESIGLKMGTLRAKLNGYNPNNTSFIRV